MPFLRFATLPDNAIRCLDRLMLMFFAIYYYLRHLISLRRYLFSFLPPPRRFCRHASIFHC